MDEKKTRIKNLIKELNLHTKYYDKGTPLISDKDWDQLYFELKELEKESQVIYADSPTQKISFETVSKLEKIKHNHPMLSLDKTKDLEVIADFIKGHQHITMAKMDGLTCSLKYENGILVQAETRGDGLIGENILHNVRHLKNVPNSIPYKGELIIDGEIICADKDFEDFKKDYKNARNFAAGSIRLLDAKETSTRKLSFIAWDVIVGLEELKDLSVALDFLYKNLGFDIVPYTLSAENLDKEILTIQQACTEKGYPIDGLVFKYNDRDSKDKYGQTEHHFKNALAYKFYDEMYKTKIKYIDWTMGRTGVLTPVAVFFPVEIDGTVVEKASLHNLSILKELNLKYAHQEIEVFKANQIVPQIAKVYPYNGEEPSVEGMEIPKYCPICGKPTEIVHTENSVLLMCSNSLCEGKLINHLDHFCGKKGLDIKGLSKATLEKLLDWGWIKSIKDIFELYNYQEDWEKKDGFGKKSVSNILSAIENSKHCSLDSFICAIGIPLVGRTASKDLAQNFHTWEDFKIAVENKNYSFELLPNFGFELNKSIKNFNYAEADEIYNLLEFKEEKVNNIENTLNGYNIVITGKLALFKNRNELKERIENNGGKVTSSISNKTSLLINNDITSNSSKNLKAKELNIPIVTEENFVKKFFDF